MSQDHLFGVLHICAHTLEGVDMRPLCKGIGLCFFLVLCAVSDFWSLPPDFRIAAESQDSM